MASNIYNNSIFWIEVEKIKPNPYQPRKEFDELRLRDLADSIRQYGILQPLVVTRKEVERGDGGLAVEYELIAGERRLRAAKLAGLTQVPTVIRIEDEDSERAKLEIAIIENVQREDLNPVDRARAFKQLTEDFGFKHHDVAKKISKSREYVSNTIRLLSLPEDIINALLAGAISEGHARPLLMLSERPEEQSTLFKDIVYKKLNVRDAERIARETARERARKKVGLPPELQELEEKLVKRLGARVVVEARGEGGVVTIDFASSEEIKILLSRLAEEGISSTEETDAAAFKDAEPEENVPKKDDEEFLYSVKNFTI